MRKRCENPNCTHDYCVRRYLYGDMILCHICFFKIPARKRIEAVRTGKIRE